MALQQQQQMKATLAKSGIAFKRIDVYGSQIMVTAWSEDAAKKWSSLLANFSTVNAVYKTRDENRADGAVNPRSHRVWRVSATI